MRLENRLFAMWPKPRLPLPVPTQNPCKNCKETGGTVTHALQVLHTLLCTQPSKDDTIQACHTYTHTLLGVAVEEVEGPSGLPAKLRANTAVLSSCGLTSTTLRVPVPGLGGKECNAAQREYVSFMAKLLGIFSSQCLV